MFGRLYHLGARRAGVRADELLERFGLADTGRKAVGEYSGGMRRRLDLAASLITGPEVLFLDEPTTGLDPRGRAEVWAAVRSLVGGGTTVLLTGGAVVDRDRRLAGAPAVDRMAALARTVRVLAEAGLFGNPGGGGDPWAAAHAELLAIVWPLALLAVFFPLAVRRFARLNH